MKLGIEELGANTFSEEDWEEFVSHAERPELVQYLGVRTKLQQSLTNGLINFGFVHPPTYLFSTCTDPLNHETEAPAFNYYGQELSAVQSLIFHKMAILGLCGVDKVFWSSPNIRKELGVTNLGRYSTEFTQVDFEMADKTMEDGLSLIQNLANTALGTRDDFNRYDVVEYANKHNIPRSLVEQSLSKVETRPFFLTNLKREAYDRRDDRTGKYLNFDLCMPKFGEVLSGGEREWEYDRLKLRMVELGYPLHYFEPILRLAAEGKLRPSVGGGFGLERLTRAMCGVDNLVEVYPFKRLPGKKVIF